jgi:hypothetical protein
MVTLGQFSNSLTIGTFLTKLITINCSGENLRDEVS